MCHLTAQSLTTMNTSEHFQVLKLLGEGSYGKVMLAIHRKRGGDHRKANVTLQLENPCSNNIILCLPGTPMALKFFSRESTSLYTFLKEYNFSLSFCSHPSLTSALGIAYFTPSHYIFAQQAGLFGDLYNVIMPEVLSHVNSQLQDCHECLCFPILGMRQDSFVGSMTFVSSGIQTVRNPVTIKKKHTKRLLCFFPWLWTSFGESCSQPMLWS